MPAAAPFQIPVVDLYGGAVTEGATIDELSRHAITKLSHIHFTTNKKSFNNLVKLGEEKWRIFIYGLSINDIIYNFKKLSINQIKIRRCQRKNF